ncbi:MAG: hypothetical protein M0R46_08945 [Candidatus Muirbacterium halophilum]|nr:hypothetical protein [Candidatus Muirbacterium halophilum]MCK9476032.1 hypothetical protein [Candidatus Muirbacterium halophilum]
MGEYIFNIDNRKNVIIVSICVLVFIFLFMSCGEEDKTNVSKKNDIKQKISDYTEIVEDLYIEPIPNIKKFIIPQTEGFQIKTTQNDKSFWTKNKAFALPMHLREIRDMIRRGQYMEAEDRLMIIEKNADYDTMGWLIYLKAEIYYNAGDYAFAKVFYEEHLKRFPGHVLENNVRNTISYIKKRYNI